MAKLIYKNPQNNGAKNYIHIIFRHFYSNDENELVCLSKDVIAAFTCQIWNISSIKHFIKIKMSNLWEHTKKWDGVSTGIFAWTHWGYR